jgi:hypothetical protein
MVSTPGSQKNNVFSVGTEFRIFTCALLNGFGLAVWVFAKPVIKDQDQ